MLDNPVSPSEYGQPPASCKEECEKLCKGRTVNELNQIADYFRNEAQELDSKIDSTITTDDFAKMKKSVNVDDQEPQPDNDGKGLNSSL